MARRIRNIAKHNNYLSFKSLMFIYESAPRIYFIFSKEMIFEPLFKRAGVLDPLIQIRIVFH